jgi:hypothetical protein
MRGWLSAFGSAVAVGAVLFGVAAAEAVDAVRGRPYQITKRHGPWMILVCTLHAPPSDRRSEGMTPKQAADELVFELRKHGIPAYAFQQKDYRDTVNTRDRIGRMRRSFTAYHGGIAVLAGNYPSASDDLAQATLKYVKKFQPKFLAEVEGRKKAGDNTEILRLRSGGLFRKTPGRPTPFAGAHMTPNPLLTSAELHSRKHDPLLLKLNADSEVSLLNNRGKYTVVVASFYGKSLTAAKGSFDAKADSFKVTNSLDLAGQAAWELAVALRKYKRIKAWVYHDRYKSVVTVGEFVSENDPQIEKVREHFGAKRREVTDRNHRLYGAKPLTAEMLTIPLKPLPGQNIERRWIFDPKPELMLVPQLSK